MNAICLENLAPFFEWLQLPHVKQQPFYGGQLARNEGATEKQKFSNG